MLEAIGDLAYARVDLVRDDLGAWRLMEAELIEPELFLSCSDLAPHSLARAMLEVS